MKAENLISLKTFRENEFKTHALTTTVAHYFSELLSDEQLELVCGGMRQEQFSIWRTELLNSLICERDESGSKKN